MLSSATLIFLHYGKDSKISEKRKTSLTVSKCLYPISIRNPLHDKYPSAPLYIEVPCGKCLACRTNRQNSWAFRLSQEQKRWKYSYFLTLTYNDESLVYGGYYATLVPSHLSQFIKRLRSWAYRRDPRSAKDKKGYSYLSFFGCGEYGDNFHRPHYHCIIFTDFFVSKDFMQEAFNACWHFADPRLNDIGEVNMKSMKYIAKYSVKQLGSDYAGIKPPFALMSRRPSIGKNYLTKTRVSQFRNNKNFLVHDIQGTPYMLPRYYKDKIFTDRERARISIESYNQNSKLQQFKYEMGLVVNPYRETDVLLHRRSEIEKRFYSSFKTNGIYV